MPKTTTPAGGPADPATLSSASPTTFPFSFDAFMDNFNGWSANATVVDSAAICPSVRTRQSKPKPDGNSIQGNSEGIGGGSGGGRDADAEGGFGFLLNFGCAKELDPDGYESSMFASNTDDELGSFFPTSASDATNNKVESLNFDFASFFLNREEPKKAKEQRAEGTGEESNAATRPSPKHTKQSTASKQSPPLLPLPPATDEGQTVSFTTKPSQFAENADRAACANQIQKKDLKTIQPAAANLVSITSATDHTAVNSSTPCTLAFNVSADMRSENKERGDPVVPGMSAPLNSHQKAPSSELSLSAALAAASFPPQYASSRSCVLPTATCEEDVGEQSVQAINGEASMADSWAEDGLSAGDVEGGAKNEEETGGRDARPHITSAEITEENNKVAGLNPADSTLHGADERLRTTALLPPNSASDRAAHSFNATSLETQDAQTLTARRQLPTTLTPSTPQPIRTQHSFSVDEATSVTVPNAALTNLLADAQRACERAAEVEEVSRLSSVPPKLHHSYLRGGTLPTPPSSIAAAVATAAGKGVRPASSNNNSSSGDASDAVFFAEVAQLRHQLARLSDEATKTAAQFQAQTSDFLRLLGPHAGLAGFVGEEFAATPVVHLEPFLVSLLEDLLKEEEETSDEEDKNKEQ